MSKRKIAPKHSKTIHKGKLVPPIVSFHDSNLRFKFDSVDLDGPWCLTNITKSDHKVLLKKLKEFESMKVAEVFFKGSEPGKQYKTSSIIQEAQKRLIELNRDDNDEIYRLRLSGLMRIYGMLSEDSFSIMWWDPEHQICPSELSNT